MDEDKLNLSVRKFLKQVGITSQRIIETNIRDAISNNKISLPNEIKITANIKIEKLNINEEINGKIEVE